MLDWEGKLGRGVWLMGLGVAALWCEWGWGWDVLDGLWFGLGVVFLVTGGASFVDWTLWRFGLRLEQIERSRTAAQSQLAHALKDLNERQMTLVEKVGVLSLEALLGQAGAQWSIRGPGMRNIPLDVMQDFLELSGETLPYLWPVREHERFTERYGYENGEAWLGACTRVLIDAGWAEAASGPYSAKLVRDAGWVRLQFGVG